MSQTTTNRLLLLAMTAATLMGLYGVVHSWNAQFEPTRAIVISE